MFLVFSEELEVKGIKAYRFRLPHPKIIFDHPDYCFCPVKQKGECLKQGVFSLAPCRDGKNFLTIISYLTLIADLIESNCGLHCIGAPVSFSAPHFFQSYEPYQEGVDGLHPSSEAHDTFVDVEPVSFPLYYQLDGVRVIKLVCYGVSFHNYRLQECC